MSKQRLFKILKTIINNEQRLLFVITDKKLEFVNNSFLNFYKVKNMEEFIEKYEVPCNTIKVNKQPLTKSCQNDDFYTYMKTLENKEIQIADSYFKLDIFKVDEDSYVLALNDITGIYNDRKKFDKLANYDQLTGIYNRYKLHEFFEIKSKFAKRYNSNLTAIMFDIDNFKLVNDNFGHDIGDYVLQELVKITKNSIRETDIFSRWGGEEFVILLLNTNINEAKIVAENIRKNVANHNFDKVKTITISLGVAKYQKENTLEKLVKKCDIVLYKAKKNGKNRVEVYDF